MLALASALGKVYPARLGTLSAVATITAFNIAPMLGTAIVLAFPITANDSTCFYLMAGYVALSIPGVLCLPRQWMRPRDELDEYQIEQVMRPAEHALAVSQACSDWSSTHYCPLFVGLAGGILTFGPFVATSNLALFYVEDRTSATNPGGIMAGATIVGTLLSMVLLVPFGRLLDKSTDPMGVYLFLSVILLVFGCGTYLMTSSTLVFVFVVLSTSALKMLTCNMVPVFVAILKHVDNPAHLNRDMMLAMTAPFAIGALLSPAVGFLMTLFAEGIPTFTRSERPTYSSLGYQLLTVDMPAVEILLAMVLIGGVRSKMNRQGGQVLV